MANYGGYVQRFREIELTRTKFTSILKAEMFMVPIVLGFSILFWSLIWRLGPIPSPAYPFAQKMWRLQALNRCLWISGTVSAGSWVCDAEGKIRVFDRGEWVLPPEGCPEFCYGVANGGMGDRWVASSRGLYRYQGGQWNRIGPEDEVTSLAVDTAAAGRIWAATHEGVLWASKDTWHNHDPPPGGFREPVRKILVDRDGSAWFVSDPGVLRYDGVVWTRFTQEDGLLENHVNDLAVAREGNLWLLFESGLLRFDGRGWLRPDGSEILNGFGAQCMAIDAMDGRWIGSGVRILRHGAVWEEEPMPDLPVESRIVSLGTVNNDLWFATETAIWRRSSGKWEDLSALEGAPSPPAVSMDVRAGKRFLLEALKPPIIAAGLGVGLLGLVVLSTLGLPATVVYGFIRSMGHIPHMILPEILGALLGRYYMAKKFGPENWRKYTPVLAAGFSCGMGLVGMAAVAIVLAAKSVIPSVF
jgi:ligand-binding sensor domain-containing protein